MANIPAGYSNISFNFADRLGSTFSNPNIQVGSNAGSTTQTGSSIGSTLGNILKSAGVGFEIYDFAKNPSIKNAVDVGMAALSFTPIAPLGWAYSIGNLIYGLFKKTPKVKYKSGAAIEFAGDNAYDSNTKNVYFKVRKPGDDETYAYNLVTGKFYKVGDEDTYEAIKNGTYVPDATKLKELSQDEVGKELSTVNKKELEVTVFNPRTFQTMLFNDVLKDTEEGRQYIENNTVQYGDIRYDPNTKIFYNENGEMFAYIDDDNKIYSTLASKTEKEKVGKELSESDARDLLKGTFLGEVRDGVPMINYERIVEPNFKNNLQAEAGEIPLSMIYWGRLNTPYNKGKGRVRTFNDLYGVAVNEKFNRPDLQFKYYESPKIGKTFAVDPEQFTEEERAMYWAKLPEPSVLSSQPQTGLTDTDKIGAKNTGLIGSGAGFSLPDPTRMNIFKTNYFDDYNQKSLFEDNIGLGSSALGSIISNNGSNLQSIINMG